MTAPSNRMNSGIWPMNQYPAGAHTVYGTSGTTTPLAGTISLYFVPPYKHYYISSCVANIVTAKTTPATFILHLKTQTVASNGTATYGTTPGAYVKLASLAAGAYACIMTPQEYGYMKLPSSQDGQAGYQAAVAAGGTYTTSGTGSKIACPGPYSILSTDSTYFGSGKYGVIPTVTHATAFATRYSTITAWVTFLPAFEYGGQHQGV